MSIIVHVWVMCSPNWKSLRRLSSRGEEGFSVGLWKCHSKKGRNCCLESKDHKAKTLRNQTHRFLERASCLLEKRRDREERNKRRDTRIFHRLVYSLQGCNGETEAPKPRTPRVCASATCIIVACVFQGTVPIRHCATNPQHF